MKAFLDVSAILTTPPLKSPAGLPHFGCCGAAPVNKFVIQHKHPERGSTMNIRTNKRSFGNGSAASMSDIAFLLLIFFLVTTIFAHDEGIHMLLPVKAPPRKIPKNNVVTIQAHANGVITINNEQVPLNQIQSDIKQRVTTNDKLVIVLETHKDTEYGLMVDILDELRLADARRITLREMSRSNNEL